MADDWKNNALEHYQNEIDSYQQVEPPALDTTSTETPVETKPVEQETAKPSLMEQALEPKNALTDFNDLTKAGATGVGDTIFDVAGFVGDKANIPWLKGLDNWWDENNPELEDPVHQLVRDVSAIVIPTMIGGGAVIGTAANATKAMAIPSAMRTLGSLAAELGVSTAVVGVSSQSVEDPNASQILNEWLGWNLPWATHPSNSPELNRKYHMYNNVGIEAAALALRGIFAFGKQIKYINRDFKAQEILSREADLLKKALKEGDFVTEAVEVERIARLNAQIDEGVKRIMQGVSTGKYDPFVNTPSSPFNKAVTDLNPNAVGAKADLYSIQNNINTVDGNMRTAASRIQQDDIKDAFTGNERATALKEFFDNDLSANADVIIGDKAIGPRELAESVDKLVNSVFNPEVSFNEFQKIIEGSKHVVFRGRKFLDEESWVKASYAYKKAFDNMFNPNLMRSSAVNTQQAADTIATTARGIELIQGVSKGTRQYDIIFDKMRLLVGEVRANEYISNRASNMKKLIKTNNVNELTTWLENQAENFDEFLVIEKRKSASVLKELENIAHQNPEYLEAFRNAYSTSNGDIDTLSKLHRWAESNIGLIKKGIYDRHPEMPSWIIQGINGIRYNSVLSGLSSARAITGNAVMSLIKPISVFAGASAQGDIGQLKRAMYTYGGIMENMKRAFKVMGDEWRLANSNPEIAVARGRKDLQLMDMTQFNAMEEMAQGWKAEGLNGKVAMWNIGKGLSYWNNSKFVRYGINSMYAIDGFTNSLMASGMSRAKAYDELFKATNGAFVKSDFQKIQKQLYSESFDASGKLTNKAADFASKEIKLNLDYGIVEQFNHIINHVPAAKGLFLFPRTGVNALEYSWSFNPISNLTPAITRAQRTLRAITDEQIAEVMIEHGLENTPEAFKALQSEYIGRQIMGSTVIMGTGMWALEGNITGSGPEDPAERQRMMSMGWKPWSIKNPITGNWHSYKGFEPFSQILALTSDIIYQAERVDSSLIEDTFSKLAMSINLNVANDTFIQGFEPLVSMFNGDEYAWNRFIAGQIDMAAPFKGIRTILNNIITPQLKDVENDWFEMLKNMNKFAFGKSSKDGLVDMLDVYTGRPIRTWEEMNVAANALMPMFKQNGDMEPWRQWLLSTGWDGLQRLRSNRVSGTPLTPHDRQFLNNHMATFGGLREQIIEMMERPDGYWDKKMNEYKRVIKKSQYTQNEFPIEQWIVHVELDRIHNRALDKAFIALAKNNEQYVYNKRLQRLRKVQLGMGDAERAAETVKQILEVQQ